MAIFDRIINSILYRISRKYLLDKFEFWEKHGIHILPVSYYSPVPNMLELRNKLEKWDNPMEMQGFDWNEEGQYYIMSNVFNLYSKECDFPQIEKERLNDYDYFIEGSNYPIGDAFILHCLIRHYKPKRIIEIGSGFSTLVAARAGKFNTPPPELISIDPFPSKFEDVLSKGFPGFKRLEVIPVENLPVDYFNSLQENDILFIDSTHVIKPNGDILYLYLNVIPRLKPGVIVHAHDIFLPFNYPKKWVFENHWFWNEQYLLWAYLLFNHEFEIIFSAHYMKKYIKELQTIFHGYWTGGSFWFRKKSIDNWNSQR